MKRFLLASTSSLALITAAGAADAPVYPTKTPPVATQWSWQGFYVGINGGIAWHRATVSASDAAGDVGLGSLRSTGGTFGAQLGYNWQSGNLVYGIEADLNWINASASGTGTAFGPFILTGPFSWSTSLSWLSTVRGRLGVTMSPMLLYVTGGFAVGGVTNNVPLLFLGYPPDHSTKTGWTAGVGIEYLLGTTPNWIVRAEVLYADLGRSSVNPFPGYVARFANKVTLARLGLSLKW